MLNHACAAPSWAKKVTKMVLFFFVVIFIFRIFVLQSLVLKSRINLWSFLGGLRRVLHFHTKLLAVLLVF